jgi:hypothetical protein
LLCVGYYLSQHAKRLLGGIGDNVVSLELELIMVAVTAVPALVGLGASDGR